MALSGEALILDGLISQKEDESLLTYYRRLMSEIIPKLDKHGRKTTGMRLPEKTYQTLLVELKAEDEKTTELTLNGYSCVASEGIPPDHVYTYMVDADGEKCGGVLCLNDETPVKTPGRLYQELLELTSECQALKEIVLDDAPKTYYDAFRLMHGVFANIARKRGAWIRRVTIKPQDYQSLKPYIDGITIENGDGFLHAFGTEIRYSSTIKEGYAKIQMAYYDGDITNHDVPISIEVIESFCSTVRNAAKVAKEIMSEHGADIEKMFREFMGEKADESTATSE